jgi:hypothetical protein
VDGSQHQQRYPSRLGFFHSSSTETRTSYIDTAKLCIQCLDAAVPDGFSYWPTPTLTGRVDGADSKTADALVLSLFRAGTEGFSRIPLLPDGRLAPNHTPVAPVSISVPGVDGVKGPWLWLTAQRKPFYINQLHLATGWSPQAQLAAERDCMIAGKLGARYVPVLPESGRKQPKSSRSSALIPGLESALPQKIQESNATRDALEPCDGRKSLQGKADVS